MVRQAPHLQQLLCPVAAPRPGGQGTQQEHTGINTGIPSWIPIGINLSLDLGRFIAYAPIHVDLATRSTADPTVFTGTKRTFTYSVALVVPEADVLEPFTDVQVGIRWCR